MTPRWFFWAVLSAAILETLVICMFWPPPDGWRAELSTWQMPTFSLMRDAERRAEEHHEQIRLRGEEIKRKQQEGKCRAVPGLGLRCDD